MPCAGPDVAHRPTQTGARTGQRKYVLFQAAADGCLECVTRLVEAEGMDPNSASNRAGYTAISFAEYRIAHGAKNPGEVRKCIAYLAQATSGPRFCTAATAPPSGSQGGFGTAATGPPSGSQGGSGSKDSRATAHPGNNYMVHVPCVGKGTGTEPVDYLMQAAEDGCLECVKHLVEVAKVDPGSRNAEGMDAADFAEERANACWDVAKYLHIALERPE